MKSNRKKEKSLNHKEIKIRVDPGERRKYENRMRVIVTVDEASKDRNRGIVEGRNRRTEIILIATVCMSRKERRNRVMERDRNKDAD